MVTAPPPASPATSHNLVRILCAAAAPSAPDEVSELGRVDVLVDDTGLGVGEVVSHEFAFFDGQESETVLQGCTPMHIAFNVWGEGVPDALVAHDAASAGVVFGPGITRRLPWISLHRVARRVRPKAPIYSLEGLVRWRASLGRLDGACPDMPTGAAREAYLSALLLTALLQDPVLRIAGQPVRREDTARHRRAGAVLADMVRRDGLQAAVRISSLPGPPLRVPPGPWDDQRDWLSVGVEDLSWFAQGHQGDWVRKAARDELARRARTAAGEVPRWHGLLLRRAVRPA